MAFVIDASVVLAWHFRDEHWQSARLLALRSAEEGVVVPAYFFHEVANGLLRGERSRRTRQRAAEAFVGQLGTLSFDVDDVDPATAFPVLLPFARTHGLRMFDAGYLHLAMRRGLALATYDALLAEAAIHCGVPLLET